MGELLVAGDASHCRRSGESHQAGPSPRPPTRPPGRRTPTRVPWVPRSSPGLDRAAQIEVLAPRRDLPADKIDDDRIVRDTADAIASPRHFPVPFDRNLRAIG